MEIFSMYLESKREQNPCTFNFHLDEQLKLSDGVYYVALASIVKNFDVSPRYKTAAFASINIISPSSCGEYMLDILKGVDVSKNITQIYSDQLLYVKCQSLPANDIRFRLIDAEGRTLRVKGDVNKAWILVTLQFVRCDIPEETEK